MIGQVSPHPEWRIIVGLVREAEYGAVVSHADLTAATGLVYPTPRYFGQVSRAACALRREHDRVLVSQSGIGYRVIDPSECNGEARRQVRFGMRRIRRGRETTSAAPDHLLTDDQRQRKTAQLAKLGSLEAMTSKTLRETRPAALAARPDVPKMLSQ